MKKITGIPAPLPENESERLNALYEHGILDTAPEAEFDDLARLAAFVCGTPIAAVTLVDAHRQWFKSIMGLSVSETPRDIAFCAHTILHPDLTVIPDAHADERFADNLLVTADPGIRFYAGMPLVSDDGYALGALCVIDRVARELTAEQAGALRTLARQVSHQLSAARAVRERERLVAEKEQANRDRERAEAALGASYATLAESEERLRRLLDAAFEGIAISQDNVLTDASPAFAGLFGYAEPAEMIGLAGTAQAAPESLDLVRKMISTNDEHPYEATLIRRDGIRFAAELRGRQIQIGGRPARVTAIRDVSERRAMEQALRDRAEELRRSEAELRAVLDAAPVILYATDANGVVTLSEGTGLSALGLKPGEAVGRSIFDMNRGGERTLTLTRRALAGEPVSYDAVVNDHSLHVKLRPARGLDGHPNGMIGVCFDVTELKQAEETIRDYAVVLEYQYGEMAKANAKLEELAITDGLTGLRNHRAFQERLGEEVVRAARYKTPLSLILLDIDKFKLFNDTFGHPAGDNVLRQVGKILRSCSRDCDLVARYGGEEFVLIVPQTGIEGTVIYAERVRAAIEAYPWPLRNVTASFGVAAVDSPNCSGADLIARADRALYTSKNFGRNQVSAL